MTTENDILIKEFNGKTVRIYTIDAKFYQGILLSHDEYFLKINDRVSGIKYITRANIQSINPVKE